MPLARPHLLLLMASSRYAATTNNPTVNALLLLSYHCIQRGFQPHVWGKKQRDR